MTIKPTDKMVLQTNKNKMIDTIVESNLKKLDRIGDISEIAIQNQATN